MYNLRESHKRAVKSHSLAATRILPIKAINFKHVIRDFRNSQRCSSGLSFSCYVALRDWCLKLGDNDSSSSRVEMSMKELISFNSYEIPPLRFRSPRHLGTSGKVPITQWSRATSQENADFYHKMFVCFTIILVHIRFSLRFSVENIVRV
jgi:hypothetical protein